MQQNVEVDLIGSTYAIVSIKIPKYAAFLGIPSTMKCHVSIARHHDSKVIVLMHHGWCIFDKMPS